MNVIYEDNHLVVCRKAPGEIVQGDQSGDLPMCDEVKAYLKSKYNKPGNVFCGVVHRIDRPVGGIVIFARTTKALGRLNDMLRHGEIHKTYWALVEGQPEFPEGRLESWIVSNGRINKSFEVAPHTPGAKHALLEYRTLAVGQRYTLLEIRLLTGRKHQIRVQLSSMGNPIKGDLKYGARRSNADASISLLAKKIEFTHPVSRQPIELEIQPTAEMQRVLNEGEQEKRSPAST